MLFRSDLAWHLGAFNSIGIRRSSYLVCALLVGKQEVIRFLAVDSAVADPEIAITLTTVSCVVGDPEITISLAQSFECAVIRTKPQLPLLA